MELTGKAKQDFEEWYIPQLREKREDYNKFSDEVLLRKFYRKPNNEKWGVYVDFFDSKGIVIMFDIDTDLNIYDEIIIDRVDIYIEGHVNAYDQLVFYSREDARAEAIKKANEIYNDC